MDCVCYTQSSMHNLFMELLSHPSFLGKIITFKSYIEKYLVESYYFGLI